MLKHLSEVLQGFQVMNNFQAKTTQIHIYQTGDHLEVGKKHCGNGDITWRSFGTNPASTAARVAPTIRNRKTQEASKKIVYHHHHDSLDKIIPTHNKHADQLDIV